MIKAQPRFVPVILLTALNDSSRGAAARPRAPTTFSPSRWSRRSCRFASPQCCGSSRSPTRSRWPTAGWRSSPRPDALTTIANRRRIDTLYTAKHVRAQRYHRPLSVLMVDIDHFKNVNDTYGHPSGDAALKAVAKALAETIRQSDHVGRFGEESGGCARSGALGRARARRASAQAGRIDRHADRIGAACR